MLVFQLRGSAIEMILKHSFMPLRFYFLLAVCCLPLWASGLIVVDGKTRSDNTFNTTAPSNGAPWSNVAQQQRMVSGTPIIDSSAVYIGNGYVLTASHTYGPTSVILDGVAYSVDPTFPAIAFTPIDVRLYKILNPPTLPLIPFPDASEADLNLACTMIGWGKGKGAIVSSNGWQWGDDTTKAKRWGTNKTVSTTAPLAYLTYSYNAAYTTFDATNAASGQTEGTATASDSGGALFQQFTGVWKLSGILTLVSYDLETYPNGNSFYNQGYASYAVRTKDLADKWRYRQWKAAKGIAGTTPPGDDSDRDGIGLLQEYAFGLDPAVAANTGLPVPGVEGTDATLIYQLERTRTDLTVQIEESPDLVTWAPANVTSTSTVSDNGTIRTYRAKIPLGGADKKFLRLKLTALTN